MLIRQHRSSRPVFEFYCIRRSTTWIQAVCPTPTHWYRLVWNNAEYTNYIILSLTSGKYETLNKQDQDTSTLKGLGHDETPPRNFTNSTDAQILVGYVKTLSPTGDIHPRQSQWSKPFRPLFSSPSPSIFCLFLPSWLGGLDRRRVLRSPAGQWRSCPPTTMEQILNISCTTRDF